MKRLLIVAILLCVPPLHAAVTFDSTFEKHNTGASPLSFASNAGTVSGTVTGANSNRVLMGLVAFFRNGSSVGTVTMTWNAASMSQLTHLDNGTLESVYLFGLIAPAGGNNTLSCAWTGTHAGDTYCGAVSLFNADQVTGWQNVGTDTATGTAASSTVTSANGNMAVVGHQNDNANSTTINVGTSAWIDTALNSNSAMGYHASSSGSTVVSWTLGTSVVWMNVKADVIAFGGGGSPTCTPTLELLGVSQCGD